MHLPQRENISYLMPWKWNASLLTDWIRSGINDRKARYDTYT